MCDMLQLLELAARLRRHAAETDLQDYQLMMLDAAQELEAMVDDELSDLETPEPVQFGLVRMVH